MAWNRDIETLLKWACLKGPAGRLAYIAGDEQSIVPLDPDLAPLVERLSLESLLTKQISAAGKWKGIYLQISAATLSTCDSLAVDLHAAVEGPVLIRVSAASTDTREITDARFLGADWQRHPLLLTVVNFVSLEAESGSLLLAYLPIPKAVAKIHSLEKLAAERNLHMDMLREAGRRSDAHLARYTWALDYIRPNDHVVDAACGLGYGSAMIRAGTACSRVTGLDLSSSAIAYAAGMYAEAWKTLDFQVHDLSDLSFLPANSVDCFVSFETFEHLVDPQDFATQIQRVLKPGGRLLCSVPNRWVDETGKDPSPYHLHTFDLQTLLKVCGKFRFETLIGQCAGGSDPRFSSSRRLDAFVPANALTDERAAGVEWWLLSAMKDPFNAAGADYNESVFPTLQLYPKTAPYKNGYNNPWIVHALVHMPFRLRTRTALLDAAHELAATTEPGTADHGAALAVLAYQALNNSAGSEIAVLDEISQQIRIQLAKPPKAPHELRWHISLTFVLAQLTLATGNVAQARQEFETCAGLDFQRFAPHIATKTTEAAFHAGRLALYAGDFVSARRNFARGLSIGRLLNQVSLDEILFDPAHPHFHGLGDGLREYVLALDSVSRCANGLALLGQYERTGCADILSLERSWQWEVKHLTEELKTTVADSNQRLNQISILTTELQVQGNNALVLQEQITTLTALAKSHEAEAKARLEQVQQLNALLKKSDAESADRAKQITQLTVLTKSHESESTDRAKQIAQLTALTKSHESESADRAKQIAQLTALTKSHESESADRADQIAQLTALVKDYEIRLAALHRELSGLNETSRASLTEKDRFLQATHAQMQEMGRVLQEKEKLVAQLNNDTRILNYLIHSGQLTSGLQASLHQVQAEAALANQLLALSASLPAVSPVRWIQLPPTNLDIASSTPVVSNLETIERGPNLTRIRGWGFAEAPHAVASDPPCLIFSTPQALWLLCGVTMERPDVVAAYPSQGTATLSRLRSGFVFEFPSSLLPSPVIGELRVIVGQVSGVPIMTAPFLLP